MYSQQVDVKEKNMVSGFQV